MKHKSNKNKTVKHANAAPPLDNIIHKHKHHYPLFKHHYMKCITNRASSIAVLVMLSQSKFIIFSLKVFHIFQTFFLRTNKNKGEIEITTLWYDGH